MRLRGVSWAFLGGCGGGETAGLVMAGLSEYAGVDWVRCVRNLLDVVGDYAGFMGETRFEWDSLCAVSGGGSPPSLGARREMISRART